jgi:helix-turn-helix protein/uncharacterized protein DUF4115
VFEIGSSLRSARERRKLDVADVARTTHIRERYLQALEDERFDALPGEAYVKGFLRTYADQLGLDGQQFVEEYNTRFPPPETPETAPLVRVRPRRRLRLFDARLVVILVAVAIGLFVWRTASSGNGNERSASVPTPVHVAASTVQRGPPAPSPPPAPQTARVDLIATRGPCWLSVRLGSDTGRLLYERTLEAGQRARFVANRLWLRIGAPWNIDATLNGRRAQLPGSLANVLVTPQALRPAGG